MCCQSVRQITGSCKRTSGIQLLPCAKSGLVQVAMAQGKQGIWMLTFPDRENTGNLVNLIYLHRKNFVNLEFF